MDEAAHDRHVGRCTDRAQACMQYAMLFVHARARARFCIRAFQCLLGVSDMCATKRRQWRGPRPMSRPRPCMHACMPLFQATSVPGGRGEEARARLKQRVAALDAAEAARRFQAESLGLHNEQAGPAPDMGRFVEQLTGRVRGPHLLPPPPPTLHSLVACRSHRGGEAVVTPPLPAHAPVLRWPGLCA